MSICGKCIITWLVLSVYFPLFVFAVTDAFQHLIVTIQ